MTRTRTPLTLRVNGQDHAVVADAAAPLLAVLRNDLGLSGPKYGCGLGECGACAVLLEGRHGRSCCIPVGGVAGRAVTTLEGLAAPDGRLHPVQQAFLDTQAAQCGYCLNGMVMATVALLAVHPRPTDAQARAALQHNLCRCGTHLDILAAVQRAAGLTGVPPETVAGARGAVADPTGPATADAAPGAVPPG